MLAKVMVVDQWFANGMVVGNWQGSCRGELAVDNLAFLEYMPGFPIISIGFNKLSIVINASR